MPIRVQNDLPVKEILEHENIFVMDEYRAAHQDIRPIKIGLLNLMPLKEDTELQILRSLSNTPLQVDVVFVRVSGHVSKNTSTSHLHKFYQSFEEIKEQKFDGFIITFIPKPWEKEKLLATLSSALELRESRAEVRNLKKQVEILSSPEDAGFEIIGESEPMQAIFATVDKLKNTDANILILGENGTGKDLVARALYHQSPRSGNLFVGIDVGSIPEQLFESELFGYEKGAFTDARKEKPGRMEVASGGTLFLDEIGNLSLSMQAKLLTALEKRQITRLGATQPIPIDIRLICATNVNIHHLVAEGTFRQDLLYRINTIELHIPTLRERGNELL